MPSARASTTVSGTFSPAATGSPLLESTARQLRNVVEEAVLGRAVSRGSTPVSIGEHHRDDDVAVVQSPDMVLAAIASPCTDGG